MFLIWRFCIFLKNKTVETDLSYLRSIARLSLTLQQKQKEWKFIWSRFPFFAE